MKGKEWLGKKLTAKETEIKERVSEKEGEINKILSVYNGIVDIILWFIYQFISFKS